LKFNKLTKASMTIPQPLFLASNGVIHYPGQLAAAGTRFN
jgi:hypothetical protein